MNDAAALSASDRALVQVVYDLMCQKGSWPMFTAVDLHTDREIGIEDAQSALAALPGMRIAPTVARQGVDQGQAPAVLALGTGLAQHWRRARTPPRRPGPTRSIKEATQPRREDRADVDGPVHRQFVNDSSHRSSTSASNQRPHQRGPDRPPAHSVLTARQASRVGQLGRFCSQVLFV